MFQSQSLMTIMDVSITDIFKYCSCLSKIVKEVCHCLFLRSSSTDALKFPNTVVSYLRIKILGQSRLNIQALPTQGQLCKEHKQMPGFHDHWKGILKTVSPENRMLKTKQQMCNNHKCPFISFMSANISSR